jgi:phage tail sheath protein FI
MPVSPTYPGVYIEEIPSGVHTITGVATSITAFIGFTPQGPVNDPVHIFSFGDYERAFGGLAIESPLSYAVKQFFQNGGGEAYVVRVASNFATASVVVRKSTAATGTHEMLNITAAAPGTAGNNLQIDIDYITANPASLFNLRVTEFVDQDGKMVVNRTETFRNLSMSKFDPNFVLPTVNSGSKLIRVAANSGAPAITGTGTSISGTLAATDIALIDADTSKLGFVVNGKGPFELTLTAPASATTIAADIADKINAIVGGTPVAGTGGVPNITLTATDTAEPQRASIHILNAGTNNAAEVLKLGVANGGTEAEAQAAFRPVQTGTVASPVFAGLPATGSVGVSVNKGASTTPLKTISLPLWGGATGFNAAPANVNDLLAMVRAALTKSSEPLLAGATAATVGKNLRILPGPADPNISFVLGNDGADTSATTLGLASATPNIAGYAPGVGVTALGQVIGTPGNDGAAPLAEDLRGKEFLKTGIYALERVDLFNLLVMPDKQDISVLVEAITYCVRRRAFMIIDVPRDIATFDDAQKWIGGSDASSLRNRNSALYFPKVRQPDPMRNGTVQEFGAAGALAGLYARTDGERGVWKAPAGTQATIVGATGLSVTLTDKENGTLNPYGLNCLRTFPVIGTVSWGARTSKGADALADEYKYIPVRRLALFLEESLYRGTQWVVFEPNDEPLWAQIRLNLGAFMHNLFAQGAFQGQTPRDAYFVKCDKETTTQNDIDLGRVNIIVGFAPLKPAEFVIIRIQQIVRQIQT